MKVGGKAKFLTSRSGETVIVDVELVDIVK
jgi:hypothetical protein